MSPLHYHVQVFVLGFGLLTRYYYTDAAPPREGDVMNLRKISEMVRMRKVVQVHRIPSKDPMKEDTDIEIVEILLDKEDIR